MSEGSDWKRDDAGPSQEKGGTAARWPGNRSRANF